MISHHEGENCNRTYISETENPKSEHASEEGYVLTYGLCPLSEQLPKNDGNKSVKGVLMVVVILFPLRREAWYCYRDHFTDWKRRPNKEAGKLARNLAAEARKAPGKGESREGEEEKEEEEEEEEEKKKKESPRPDAYCWMSTNN